MADWEALYKRLTPEIAQILRKLSQEEAAELQEVRIFCGQPVLLVFASGCRTADCRIDAAHMDRLLGALCGFALYRFERELARGYIPLPQGHRAGVCGLVTQLDDGTRKMSSVSSICLRISRNVSGASACIREYLFSKDGRPCRLLLLGSPGCGKTTVLRDAAMYMARHVRVAVVDERRELFPQENGLPAGMDVMSGTDKAHAFEMLIRSMAPQVIVCDELGRGADVDAVLDAVRCGVGVLASAHADGMDDLLHRPTLCRLFEAGAFERYVRLGRHGEAMEVWNQAGDLIWKRSIVRNGELGDGRNGDDRREQPRFSVVGGRAAARRMDTGDAKMPFAYGDHYPI